MYFYILKQLISFEICISKKKAIQYYQTTYQTIQYLTLCHRSLVLVLSKLKLQWTVLGILEIRESCFKGILLSNSFVWLNCIHQKRFSSHSSVIRQHNALERITVIKQHNLRAEAIYLRDKMCYNRSQSLSQFFPFCLPFLFTPMFPRCVCTSVFVNVWVFIPLDFLGCVFISLDKVHNIEFIIFEWRDPLTQSSNWLIVQRHWLQLTKILEHL